VVLSLNRGLERGAEVLADKVGGTARLKVVLLLGAVLGVSTADTGAVSAVAPQLESALRIGNVEIGLLVTVSALAGAAGMLPTGWITDRGNRTHLVTVAVTCWGAAELASALAPDYTFLLFVRLALGVLSAVSGPTIASLTGDFFPARERSKIFGYILTGELVGAGLGILIAGLVTSVSSWRFGFGVLALPSFFVAWSIHHWLVEPARGGQSHIERGAETILSAEDVADGVVPDTPDPAGEPEDESVLDREDVAVQEQVKEMDIDPEDGVVAERDPMELGWWESFCYVLRVQTNRELIVASALGYFFLTGVETFALIFIKEHFGIGQGLATVVVLAVGLASVVGTVTGGRLTDALLRRGHIEVRVLIPAAAFGVAVLAFIPATVVTTLVIAVPLFMVVGFCITAPNPGLDAARLDVMPTRMWGRAEAVRSFLRSILQAFAPLVFGLVSTAFGATSIGFGSSSGIGAHAKAPPVHTGLEQTFLIMTSALAVAAYFSWRACHPYLVDVAAAARTDELFPPEGAPAPEGESGTRRRRSAGARRSGARRRRA